MFRYALHNTILQLISGNRDDETTITIAWPACGKYSLETFTNVFYTEKAIHPY